jgi:flagellar FliJ protein
MKRFRFKLEPLLRHRQRLEDDERRAVAVLVRQQVEIENQIRSLQNQVDSSKRHLGGELLGNVDGDAIRTQAAFVLSLESQMQRLALQLANVYRSVQAAREKLLEASKSRRAIERLKEMRYEEWQKNMSKSEASAIDDLVTCRFGRDEAA